MNESTFTGLEEEIDSALQNELMTIGEVKAVLGKCDAVIRSLWTEIEELQEANGELHYRIQNLRHQLELVIAYSKSELEMDNQRAAR